MSPDARANRDQSYAHGLAESPAAPLPWSAPAPVPSVWETARLRLRFWTPEDAPAMLEAINVDRGSFLPWLPWVKVDNRTPAECVAAIERMRQRRERTDPAPDDFTLGIFDRRTGGVVGGTGLHRILHDWHEAEIGYWIRPDLRRRGLCAEAVAGLIDWAFREPGEGGWGLRRIHIRCAASNDSSARVPRSLGLREEGRLVKERWTEGIGWDDTLVWGVCAAEWPNIRPIAPTH
ncbi:MAG: GNAT family N-acetyltransferase [Phycisphaerales bacterium]